MQMSVEIQGTMMAIYISSSHSPSPPPPTRQIRGISSEIGHEEILFPFS